MGLGRGSVLSVSLVEVLTAMDKAGSVDPCSFFGLKSWDFRCCTGRDALRLVEVGQLSSWALYFDQACPAQATCPVPHLAVAPAVPVTQTAVSACWRVLVLLAGALRHQVLEEVQAQQVLQFGCVLSLQS